MNHERAIGPIAALILVLLGTVGFLAASGNLIYTKLGLTPNRLLFTTAALVVGVIVSGIGLYILAIVLDKLTGKNKGDEDDYP